jgi:hypothetical protein
MNDIIAIQNTDFWVKIVEILQQNWAVIEADNAVNDGICSIRRHGASPHCRCEGHLTHFDSI